MALKKVYTVQSVPRLNCNSLRATVYRNNEFDEFIVRFYEYDRKLINQSDKSAHLVNADYHESFNQYDKQSVKDAKNSAIKTAIHFVTYGTTKGN